MCEPAIEFPGASEYEQYRERMIALGWTEWQGVDEGRWYWWWDGHEDSAPLPVSVAYSPTTDSYFATQGQLGWCRAQDLSDMGGWWMKLVEPAVILFDGGAHKDGTRRLTRGHPMCRCTINPSVLGIARKGGGDK